MKRELIKISVWVDKQQLTRLNKLMALDNNSKLVRGAINFTVNVAHNLFSGNLSNMFKRKKGNEEIDLYENP